MGVGKDEMVDGDVYEKSDHADICGCKTQNIAKGKTDLRAEFSLPIYHKFKKKS